MASNGLKLFNFITLYLIIQVLTSNSLAEPSLTICPGACIGRENACDNAIENSNCGFESICCLDNFEMVTESGFDFSTLRSVDDQWESEADSNELENLNPAEVVETDFISSDEVFTTAPSNEVFFTTEDTFSTESPREEKFEVFRNEDSGQFFTAVPSETFTSSPEEQTFEEAEFYHEEVPAEANEVIELDHCPGACIPNEHTSLCQYVFQSNLCPLGKSCCATKTAAQTLNLQKSPETYDMSFPTNRCPGKCVHPSLTVFCDNVLQGYQCPMGSACCEQAARESPVVQCTGECLPSHSTYMCLPPYELVPGSDCEQQSVCCMRTDLNEHNGIDNMATFATQDAESSGFEPTGFGCDEHGQLYYVYQNGQFQPLPTISPEDSLNPELTHVGDLDVATGKASLYKDRSGTIYQLSTIEAPANSQGIPEANFMGQNVISDQDYNPHARQDLDYSAHGNSYDSFPHPQSSNDIPPARNDDPNTVFSAPDDGDDIEENLKDVVLPEENENIVNNEDSDVPPGERTLVKPKCPGSCLSSFLRFTCIGNHKIYDGFTCTSDTVCCASTSDIEEHEQYLNTLSPFFNAPVENQENARTCFNNWPKDFHAKDEKYISDNCWQIAIINSQNQYICGGALIHDSWVLTAAHCVTGALKENTALYVRAGVADLTSAADSSAGQTRRALSIFVHHKHNSMSLDNDIAILRLQTPLHLNLNVCIACLPTTSNMPLNDSDCTVSGYGFLSKAGTMSLKLDDATVPLIEDMECITNITDALSTVFILPASSFCAGGLGNNESCQGDAGAPLMCANNGRQELTGLVSWSLGCGKDEVPSIYVKIPMFMSWINQIMSASTFLKALH